MNKLQALLIAGLLSLASVSFATSITSSTTLGSSGSILLVNDGNDVSLTGSLAAVGTTYIDPSTSALIADSVFYDLTTVNNDGLSVGHSTLGGSPYDLTYKLFSSLNFTAANQVGTTGTNGLYLGPLIAGATYYLELSNLTSEQVGYGVVVSAVPVPAAGILFASALFGAGALGRRKKKAKASVVGAFARAS